MTGDQGWRTDKVSLGYLPEYERIRTALTLSGVVQHRPSFTGDYPSQDYLSDPELNAINILEVGVAGGGGMAMFRDVFHTQNVWGVDIGPKAGSLDDQDHILYCDQADQGLPLVLEGTWAPFHLIVDDASHLGGPTPVTLANLWRLVLPGGFYVIEDWNYLEAGPMAQNLWQKLFGWMLAYPSVDLREKPPPPYSGMLEDIESVTVRDGMIIIRKRS